MIKFFRHIRMNMMSEGKTGKYMKYAIGEIILVVIGILIALSINNWNELRKSKNNTRSILMAIKAENTINIKDLDLKIKDSEHVLGNLVLLLENLGPDYMEKDEDVIDSVFFEGLSITLFDPNKASFENLINSGNIKYIVNDSLHDMLLEWSSKLDDILKAEARNLQTFKTFVIPHFYDKISLVKIDRKFDDNTKHLPPSAFPFDNRSALNSMKTENIIEDHLYNLERLGNHYKRFYSELKALNRLIEKELQ